MFYYMYPEDVAALVLIDSSHVDQDARLPKELVAKFAEIEQMTYVSSELSAFGITRLLMKMQGGSSVFPELELLPESAQSAWMDMAPRRSALKTVIQEFEAWEESCVQLKEAEIPFGELPVTVLTAGKPPFDFGASFSDVWMELQAELASASSSANHRVIEDSGHYIHIEQPEIVVEEVRSVVKKLRESASELP
jgi:pimeloyl-ACP methyl ester carboxylesterase